MKYLMIIPLLLLAGCGNPMTRLLPKVEKLQVDPILMEPPRPLKIIEKPKPQTENKDVAPK